MSSASLRVWPPSAFLIRCSTASGLKWPLAPAAYLHGTDIRWVEPSYHAVHSVLTHPAYAGAYVYGRRHHDGRLRLPGKPHSGRRFLRDPQRWTVLHRGALPAYTNPR